MDALGGDAWTSPLARKRTAGAQARRGSDAQRAPLARKRAAALARKRIVPSAEAPRIWRASPPASATADVQ